MNKTVTRIDKTPILQALNGRPLPENDPDFLYGLICGTDWYHGHKWDMPIDSQYVRDCVANWQKRGILTEQWQDVFHFHLGFVLAMVDCATNEQ
jgi:hypothetical protein